MKLKVYGFVLAHKCGAVRVKGWLYDAAGWNGLAAAASCYLY